MVKVRLDIELPPSVWIGEVSRSVPDARFRLLSGLETDGTAVELGEVVGGDVEAAAEAVRTHPTVSGYERLYADDERVLSKYRTTDRTLYELLRGAAVPPEFPYVIEDGRFEFEATATREAVREFRDTLEGLGVGHEVVSLVGDGDPDELLSSRQREVIDTAVRMGYFEVPRACSLEDVADEAGVDTSSASVTLRRGIARLVQWLTTGAGGDATRGPTA